MNGVHDMGGMQDMGPIEHEQNEPVFHEPWEGRVYAMNKALRVGPERSVDLFRFALEQIPPARYLASSYYERWLLGLEKLLLDAGVVSAEELADGQSRGGWPKVPVLTAEQVRRTLVPWRAPRPEAEASPKFNVGDRVRARNINPGGHTRLPRYVRGHVGVIERDLG
ncbi:MAG: nitrile hydratase subunit beta, partial [Chloroflexota bacterium]|nr:nitrile hydratase subunit beta [Chloroflexota bacterium]